MTVDADIIIVGGGLSGCALACALSDGRRRILVLEARAGKNPRFNGELIHPTGVEQLSRIDVLPALRAAGGADVAGFACVPAPGADATLLEYSAIPHTRPAGFAIDHHHLVEVLRKETMRRPGVEIRYGVRVQELARDQERVVGVETDKGTLRAHLVIGCDGRHSKIRALTEIQEDATLLSFTAAAFLKDCELPNPGYGHIFLGAWGPMLVYPIDEKNSRTCIDLPTDLDRGKANVIERIRTSYLPLLPPGVQRSLAAALDAGEIEMAANYKISTEECTVPGAALIGDACGCSHPLTATGMTVALNDTRLITEALMGVELGDRAAVDAALARYQGDRYKYVRAREILSIALYEVFRQADDGARAICAGIFRYWNASTGARARSMALLSGAESRLPAFIREYLTVVGRSTSTVLKGRVDDGTAMGRVRSLVGLGKKSVEKLSLVARGVTQLGM